MEDKKKKWQKWTQEEIDFITSNQKKMSVEAMAQELKRSRDSIINKLRRIPGPYNYSPWTKEEEEFLEKYYDYSKITEIAEKLNRTENSVWLKVLSLKRKKIVTK